MRCGSAAMSAPPRRSPTVAWSPREAELLLHEAVTSPVYNGCPFANANAEALSGSVGAKALRTAWDWLADLPLTITAEAGFADPHDVANQLRLLYDGVVSNDECRASPSAAAVDQFVLSP